MWKSSARIRSATVILLGLVALTGGLLVSASPAGAHFAGVDDSTNLVCDGDAMILNASAVSWAEDGTGEHPRIIIEMRSDVSDWEVVAIGAFSSASGYRVSGAAVVPEGASFVDVRVTADQSLPWGDDFSAPTPPAERRIVIGPGLEDCTSVIVPPTPVPVTPTATLACVGDTGSEVATVDVESTSTEPQDVTIVVDGVEVETVTVSASSPAVVTVAQDPGETNGVVVVFEGEIIASAEVQCVDAIIVPPEPTPGPDATVSCIGDSPDREAVATIETSSVEPQDVQIVVDGVEVGAVTVSAAEPASFVIEQDPGETNTVEVVFESDVIASADVQCVEGIILPPPPSPTPAPPAPPGPELPRTGSQSTDMTLVAVTLIGGGAAMIFGGWALRRRLG